MVVVVHQCRKVEQFSPLLVSGLQGDFEGDSSMKRVIQKGLCYRFAITYTILTILTTKLLTMVCLYVDGLKK